MAGLISSRETLRAVATIPTVSPDFRKGGLIIGANVANGLGKWRGGKLASYLT